MSRFILIDHSLKGVGGHHFEYAAHVLDAARRRGYEVVLGANRRFRPDTAVYKDCAVYPVFRHTTYCDCTLYHSGRSSEDSLGARRARDWIRRVSGRFRRGARVRSFYRGLAKLFQNVELTDGDQVFIPTLSELDLLGLARFLSGDERTKRADWHLQFHYNIFDGREPDFDEQPDRLQAMRSVFETAWKKLSGHRVRCYNTTAQLTAQYDRIGLTKFHTLPYPVSPAFRQPRDRRSASGPLRVTSAGAIRAEKGCSELADVLRQGWSDLFAPGRAQLVVQSNKSWFKLPLPDEPPKSSDPVIYAPHPLEPDAYVELLRQADIGLLLYDSERYYSRCSGVLVELLSLGVPVIVTAGCWMADQIAPAIERHIDQTMARLPTVSVQALRGIEAVIDAPSAPSELVLTAHWDSLATPGTYMRFIIECRDPSGKPIHQNTAIARVGNAAQTSIMTHVVKGTRKIRITWRDAYRDAWLPVETVEARLLSHETAGEPSCPLGAVGLIAADVSQVGDLLRDMVCHWPHYRDTAAEFARTWRSYHNADRIVSLLAGACGGLSPASRAA